jgi:hypothetical protein
VSTLEDRLRAALREDAETVRPHSIPGAPERPMHPAPGRPGSRWPRRLIPLAAAAAVVAIVGGLTLAAPHRGGSPPAARSSGPTRAPAATPLPTGQPAALAGPPPKPVLGSDAPGSVPSSAAPGTPPPFYVTFGSGSLPVRDTSTGKLTGHVSAPPGSSGFDSVTATAGGHTFVAAVLSGQGGTCTSRLYQFRLSSTGRPGPLTPLNITVPGNFNEINTLAITPDGQSIAYDTWLCGTSEGEIGVINLATRHVRIWTYGPSFTWALSLSADGHQLAFGALSGGAWVLNTSAPAGPVSRHDRQVSRTAVWATLAGSGTSLYGCSVSPSLTATVGRVTYYAQSVKTGRQQVIGRWTGLPYPQCWATQATQDPSGRYLLIEYPVQPPKHASDYVRPAILNLRTGQLTGTAAPAFYGPLDIAW